MHFGINDNLDFLFIFFLVILTKNGTFFLCNKWIFFFSIKSLFIFK